MNDDNLMKSEYLFDSSENKNLCGAEMAIKCVIEKSCIHVPCMCLCYFAWYGNIIKHTNNNNNFLQFQAFPHR